MTDHVQVSTATETHDQAVALARSAVQAKLAAGAQIVGPVTSVFWHAGEFGTNEEYQLLLKTAAARYPELEAHLVENHPWTNPEVVAVPLAAGAAPYLEWIDRTTAN
ncbi:divalent-cation tolerance protein CutA [Streptomyces sp. NPDC049936]|uniref:divalent-cation tolerance protein CutA n=1 Tax=unclassified Streptomyces TaxID=2593676 RepID=UPI0037A9E94D